MQSDGETGFSDKVMEQGQPASTDARSVWRRLPWAGIGVFYVLAVMIALPINLGLAQRFFLETFPIEPLMTWTFLPAALGPAIGVLVARRLDRQTGKSMTLLGTDWIQNSAAALLPILFFVTVGGVGILFASVAVLYALGEELGWRGYLADALQGLPVWTRYGMTGLLWWLWHFRFQTTFDWFGFPLLVLASAVVLGHAAKESKSVLVPAAMHATIILLTVSGPPDTKVGLAGLLTLSGWILMGKLFPGQGETT